MLDGAPNIDSDAAADPAYADAPFRTLADGMSYIGVPVVTAAHGVIGTLCAIDSRSIPQRADPLLVLRALADVIAAAVGQLGQRPGPPHRDRLAGRAAGRAAPSRSRT